MKEFNIREKALWVEYDGQDRFYNSRWNLREEVKNQSSLPKHVSIKDTTLREGEETPRVAYTLEQKLKIASMLDEMGVPEIDCGFASLIKEHLEFVKAIKSRELHLRTVAITRVDVPDPEKGIDLVLDAGADIVLCAMYATPLPNFTAKDYINRVASSVRYAKKCGAYTSFWTPCTRWEKDFTGELYSAAVSNGADRIELAGLGCLTPTAFKSMTKWLKGIAGDKPVGVHAHNHHGMGTACALAGVEAGAEIVDTSVNGLGDGAGIAAFEEVVLALTVFYGFDLGIDLKRVTELSDLVQEITGVRIQPYKAITGENYYIETPDSHLERCIREGGWHEMRYFRPELIGQKQVLLFGPSALGGRGVRAKAEQIGVRLSDAQLERIMGRIRESLRATSGLTEEEVEVLIREEGAGQK